LPVVSYPKSTLQITIKKKLVFYISSYARIRKVLPHLEGCHGVIVMTSNEEDIQSVQSLKAFRVFLEETAGYLTKAHEFMNENSDLAMDGQALNELTIAFHTIKGGAGFFKLKKIELLAAELEIYFGKGAVRQGSEKHKVTALLTDLEQQLEGLIEGFKE